MKAQRGKESRRKHATSQSYIYTWTRGDDWSAIINNEPSQVKGEQFVLRRRLVMWLWEFVKAESVNFIYGYIIQPFVYVDYTFTGNLPCRRWALFYPRAGGGLLGGNRMHDDRNGRCVTILTLSLFRTWNSWHAPDPMRERHSRNLSEQSSPKEDSLPVYDVRIA